MAIKISVALFKDLINVCPKNRINADLDLIVISTTDNMEVFNHIPINVSRCLLQFVNLLKEL